MIWRVVIYCAVAALAVFNGIFSPKSFVIFALQGIWYPSFLPGPLMWMFVLSGTLMALLHLMVTGIAVGLLERIRPERRNSLSSALFWLVVMLVPTAYTLQHMLAG
jgi:ABC-type Co2+ transport system permease subunit